MGHAEERREARGTEGDAYLAPARGVLGEFDHHITLIKIFGRRGDCSSILLMRKLKLQVFGGLKSPPDQVTELGFTCCLEPSPGLFYLERQS